MMCVEQLASVEGVVASLLQPDGKVSVIETLADKLGISACSDGLAVRLGEKGEHVTSHRMVD